MRLISVVWRGVVVSAPISLFAISLVLLYVGYRANAELQKIYYTIASAMLGSGIFAAVLKSMQFMGIFQEAMEKIVLGNKDWLLGLSEKKLRDLFRDVLATNVAKGFPKLSNRLGDEVFEHMLPKLRDYYYSKMYRRIEIISYDVDRDVMVIDEQYELTINAHSEGTVVPYEHTLTGPWPESEGEHPYKVASLSINEKDYTYAVQATGEAGLGAKMHYKIPLKGSMEYSVRRHTRRTTKIGIDPVIVMVAKRCFTDAMVVLVDNRVSSQLSVEVTPLGLSDAGVVISAPEPHLTRCEVKQLMFPGDGLLLVFKKEGVKSNHEKHRRSLRYQFAVWAESLAAWLRTTRCD